MTSILTLQKNKRKEDFVTNIDQVVQVVAWLSVIALGLAGFAIFLAVTAKKAQGANKAERERLHQGLQALDNLRGRVDQVVSDRVSEHLRAALGSADSVKALSTAVLTHPTFLDRLVATTRDRILDADDDLADRIILGLLDQAGPGGISPEVRQKTLQVVNAELVKRVPLFFEDEGGEAFESGNDLVRRTIEEFGSTANLSPEFQEQIRQAVGKHLVGRIEDMLENDGDLNDSIVDALGERAPGIIQELIATDDKFRKAVSSALTERVKEILES